MLLLIAGLLPVFLLVPAWYWGWPIFPGEGHATVTDIWAVIGTILGYYGVVFSGYAAYQVKELSEKYFARTRFPQIKENLDAITKEMAKAGDKKASELRSERFIASISVSLGEVERVPGHRMKELIKRAKSEKKTLIDWINNETQKNTVANTEANYWNLFRSLQEISQEITAHIKEQGAK